MVPQAIEKLKVELPDVPSRKGHQPCRSESNPQEEERKILFTAEAA
jgi:hypothetical protein